MNRDDIIRMAGEVDAVTKILLDRKAPQGMDHDVFVCFLERFAALAIKPWADQLEVERKKFKELNDVVALGMQHARADERKAIANMVAFIVDAIRARGQA